MTLKLHIPRSWDCLPNTYKRKRVFRLVTRGAVLVLDTIPRGKLIGMRVYNPEWDLVETVQDVALLLGEGEMGIVVTTRAQTMETISWSEISAMRDIIILEGGY